MKVLKCTEAEALDIIETDKAIDHGKRTKYDFDKSKEKEAVRIANIGCKTVYKFEQKTRKENPTKQTIIAELAEFLTKNTEIGCENVEITNKEKLILFKIGDNTFEIDLKQKRKPKS